MGKIEPGYIIIRNKLYIVTVMRSKTGVATQGLTFSYKMTNKAQYY